jgi:hypothetical protein
MITTRSRLFIFSPGKVLFKIGMIALTVIALLYSIGLGIRVRQSETAAARIRATTNSYMDKNAGQAERCRQIRLVAHTWIAKGSANQESIAENNSKILRAPYPSLKEVERKLGSADVREVSDQGIRLIWNQIIWEKPNGWPVRKSVRVWPCVKSAAVETWFDKSGLLTSLTITGEEDSTSAEKITR